jgi:glycosyltransferase involved in cell wall biosynthesis
MRILIVDHYGGEPVQQSFYRTLARAAGDSVTLLIPDRWRDGFVTQFGKPEAGGNFRVVPGTTYFRGRAHRAVTLRLWSLLRREKFDVLYMNAEPENFQTFIALLGRKLFAPFTKIILMSWRNIDLPKGVYPYRAPFLHSVSERVALHSIDALVAHNEAAKNILSAKGSMQIKLIPPWVDTETFQPRDKKGSKGHLGLRGYTVGYAGRLIAEKGVDLLLQASAALEFSHELLIIGSGPEEESLKRLAAQLGISNRIHWHGPAPRARLPLLLPAMDVLVLPSRTTPLWVEQFGRILIEAMACGVPVIGSDSGEIPRTIGPAGLTFPEGDPGALTQQLKRVHDDPGLSQQLANLSRDCATSLYSTNVIADLYLSFFNSVCSSKLLDLKKITLPG